MSATERQAQWVEKNVRSLAVVETVIAAFRVAYWNEVVASGISLSAKMQKDGDLDEKVASQEQLFFAQKSRVLSVAGRFLAWETAPIVLGSVVLTLPPISTSDCSTMVRGISHVRNRTTDPTESVRAAVRVVVACPPLAASPNSRLRNSQQEVESSFLVPLPSYKNTKHLPASPSQGDASSADANLLGSVKGAGPGERRTYAQEVMAALSRDWNAFAETSKGPRSQSAQLKQLWSSSRATFLFSEEVSSISKLRRAFSVANLRDQLFYAQRAAAELVARERPWSSLINMGQKAESDSAPPLLQADQDTAEQDLRLELEIKIVREKQVAFLTTLLQSLLSNGATTKHDFSHWRQVLPKVAVFD
ncbi:unnamed protein product [Amoebophrya sp. A25]|nr:unnamed protein product [Amoebophrya sp. A25]|eukprot:GSA25T00015331001.1